MTQWNLKDRIEWNSELFWFLTGRNHIDLFLGVIVQALQKMGVTPSRLSIPVWIRCVFIPVTRQCGEQCENEDPVKIWQDGVPIGCWLLSYHCFNDFPIYYWDLLGINLTSQRQCISFAASVAFFGQVVRFGGSRLLQGQAVFIEFIVW